MSKLTPSRFCWSWRSCFPSVKHQKKKSKKRTDCQSNAEKFHSTEQKSSQTMDENCNFINEFDFTSTESHYPLIPNECITKSVNSFDQLLDDNDESILDGTTMKLSNQKSSLTVRSTPLDAIVEDLNEENSEEFDENKHHTRLSSDRELLDDSNELHDRLMNLSRKNHIVIQLNENGYLLGEFLRHLEKFKLKIDDIKRASTELPRDTELLEARYSTLLATIESLSLLLKVAQISSSRSLISRLISSIEERMEQLNKLVQLSSSINLRQQRQELNDDDFLSFRSALSSYEQLLTISS